MLCFRLKENLSVSGHIFGDGGDSQGVSGCCGGGSCVGESCRGL